MDALGPLVAGKRGEGAAEGRFARNLARVVPTAAPPQRGAAVQRVKERAGGGEN
jgi:hypothetical protein